MGVEQAKDGTGRKAAAGLEKAAKAEERKVESETGRDLKKGADRFEERARSSDGRGAGEKQS